MSYKLRDERFGFHHVWCRGNNRRAVVLDDSDRRLFIRMLGSTAEQHGWQIAAYCVMSNHYHLVMAIGERGMSRGFCALNTGYATTFNQRHGRVNHLFGRRYGNTFLADQGAFLYACRYVVRNPIRAGLVDRAEDYAWSSYRATLGLTPPELPLETTQLLAAFHPRRPISRRARKRFDEFVHTPTLAEKQAAAAMKVE